MKESIRLNILYGLMAILPLAIIAWLLVKAAEVAVAISEPLREALGLETFGVVLAVMLAILAVLALCFILGSLVRTRLGSLSYTKLEQVIFKKLPFYELVQRLIRGFADRETAYAPAMVDLYGSGAQVFALVIEDEAAGADTLTVFVPASPTPAIGTVYVVDRVRVQFLDSSLIDLTDCLSQWGLGAAKLSVLRK
jgi:uncharacterized membrane protein